MEANFKNTNGQDFHSESDRVSFFKHVTCFTRPIEQPRLSKSLSLPCTFRHHVVPRFSCLACVLSFVSYLSPCGRVELPPIPFKPETSALDYQEIQISPFGLLRIIAKNLPPQSGCATVTPARELFVAVRTGFAPVTTTVTVWHSNWTELTHQK